MNINNIGACIFKQMIIRESLRNKKKQTSELQFSNKITFNGKIRKAFFCDKNLSPHSDEVF